VTTRRSGAQAEHLAEKYLQHEGFKTLERNFHARTGEIDLIMLNDDLLIFVEVRMRNNPGFGSGAETVTYAKQRKIINTASLFLQKQKHAPWQSIRFDVISMGDSIDWIPGAFTLD
jgi:putative endonuclease